MRECDIIEMIRERNELGAEAFFRHYAPLMRYIISPILKDERDREEALSETAMQVWAKIDAYDEARGSFTAWLTAITRNIALNHARGRQEIASSDALSENTPSLELTPEESVLQIERRNALRVALLELSPKETILFYRKYYYRQSTAQIAAELGMTERAVEGKLYRIKKKLREALGGDMDD